MNAQSHKNNVASQQQGVKKLIVILVIIFAVAIAGRASYFGDQTLAVGDQIWRLSMTVSTGRSPEPTALRIFPPFDTPYIRIIESSVNHAGFKVRNSSEDKTNRRSIYALANDTSKRAITAEFFVHVSQTPFTLPSAKKIGLDIQKRESYLLDSENLQLNSFMVKETVKQLLSRQPTPQQLTENIYRHTKNMALSNKPDTLNVPQVLSNKKATVLDQALVMVALSRAVGIPARLVTGIILKETFEAQLHYWVELYQDEEWSAYDIHYGYKNTVPHNYLPIRRNNINLIQVLQGATEKVSVELEQEYNHPYLRQVQDKNILNVFDFKRLPVSARDELALLLLLPLGALITALFRHLVGVHSYGVFTPTLLALAIVYNDFITTATIFMIVSLLAVGGRSLFPASITRIPRLSIIFTLVAIILAMSVSVMNYFDINQDGNVILLPIIILTSLVDRLYRTIEDKGIPIAMRRLFWTIVIALLCLPFIQFETLGYLLLQYPETHLLTLALFLLISTYKGKQLVNLPIVKLLAEPEKNHKRRESDNNKA